jgi:antitoxin (DNA-binding transcriptional repressor) of toxin-antitoxin stability system
MVEECMQPPRRSMERVPVARLKASLAAFLGKVKVGRSLIITDRGTPVAVFEPVAWDTEEDESIRELVATGQVTPPTAKLPDDFFRVPRVKDPHGLLRGFLLDERETGR